MGIFSKLFKKQKPKPEPAPPFVQANQPEPEPPKPTTKTATYKVTGVSHYEDNILRLSSKNEDYKLSKRDLIDADLVDVRVWEYDFYATRAELVPEPDNPHDQKAIKVLVDGLHVGYIKSGSCSHLLRLIREDGIVRIGVKVGGGRYKRLECVDYTESGKEIYELERDAVPLYVHLSIVEKLKQ